jgi:hypothetical protein
MKNAAMTQQKTSPQEQKSIPIFDFHPTLGILLIKKLCKDA